MQAALLAALIGCDQGPPEGPPAAEPPLLVPSKSPRVKFKGGRRLGTDLSRALGLPPDGLCQELGQYDCINDAHRIALGGIEPYQLRFNRPLETIPVTSLMAVERVVLSACGRAVTRDLEQPAEARIFGPLAGDHEPEARLRVAASLYRRLLGRDAASSETEALLSFFDEVAKTSPEPERDWAVLACFAVGTSVEALFY